MTEKLTSDWLVGNLVLGIVTHAYSSLTFKQSFIELIIC